MYIFIYVYLYKYMDFYIYFNILYFCIFIFLYFSIFIFLYFHIYIWEVLALCSDEVWAPAQIWGSFWLKSCPAGAAWRNVWAPWVFLICVTWCLFWFLLLPRSCAGTWSSPCGSGAALGPAHSISSGSLNPCSIPGKCWAPSIQNILQNEAKNSEVGRGVRRALLVWHIFNP